MNGPYYWQARGPIKARLRTLCGAERTVALEALLPLYRVAVSRCRVDYACLTYLDIDSIRTEIRTFELVRHWPTPYGIEAEYQER